MRRLIAITALLAACSTPTGMPGSGEAGMGLPQQLDGEQYPGPREPILGELTVASNGCIYLALDGIELLAIWPRGSSLSEPVRLPDGTELADGAMVEGFGAVLPITALPGDADGYWAYVTGFCGGDQPRAVVLDEVSAAR